MTSTFSTKDLNKLKNLLGGDAVSFLLPFFETDPAATEAVQDWGSHGLHGANFVTFDNDPYIRGDPLAYRFNGTDEYMEIPDNDLLSAVVAGVDVPFSVGCAFKMSAPNATTKMLIDKFDNQTPNAEYRFYLGVGEDMTFRLFDNNVVNSARGRLYNVGLDANVWYVGICTYDGRGGADANDGINIYLYTDGVGWNGAVDNTDSSGVGVYVDMENTGQPVMIGAADGAAGPNPSNFWPGDMWGPFMTRVELSAEEAQLVALTMVRMMGL